MSCDGFKPYLKQSRAISNHWLCVADVTARLHGYRQIQSTAVYSSSDAIAFHASDGQLRYRRVG